MLHLLNHEPHLLLVASHHVADQILASPILMRDSRPGHDLDAATIAAIILRMNA